MEKPRNLRELIEQGYAFPAILPERNDFLLTLEGSEYRKKVLSDDAELKKDPSFIDLSRLESISGYTVPLIAHDYAAKTSVMWNSLYERLGLKIRNIMLVADPNDAKIITDAFRKDPKYLGGGFGVGFKEKTRYLDAVIPADLSSINIVVNEQGKLVGYNTDAPGFVISLDEKLKVLERKIERGNFVVIGAGGVAKEVVRELARSKADYIVIVNRTRRKAVALAHSINTEFDKDVAIGVGENMTRGVLLNSERKPHAVINLSDKGSDSIPNATFLYASTDENGKPIEQGIIEHMSRSIVRDSVQFNPQIIYADIVLPKSGRPKSLRFVDAELMRELKKQGIQEEKLDAEVSRYTLDGKPMVVYQAAPAYVKVQEANPSFHHNKVNEEEALKIFKEAAGLG